MVPPVSHHPSANELKELHAIALDTARDALFIGWASSSFHGYQIHAYSWTSRDGTRMRVFVSDAHACSLVCDEHLHRPDPASCARDSEQEAAGALEGAARRIFCSRASRASAEV